MRKLLTLFLPIFVLGFLPGCAALGLQTPETINQKLAYGYAQVIAARQGATAALNAGQMSVADAVHVQAMADEARKGLDITKGYIATGNSQAASTQLQLEQAALYALSAYLQAKGVR